ncbi:MAG: hypothetical protein ACYDCI_06775 [Candidatus Limnocylindrales bacterium]
MNEATPIEGWPSSVLDGLALLLIALLIMFDLGRSASERLTVAVGSIRLRPPTLVPLAAAETTTAVGLLGGAIEAYFGHPDEGSPS